MVPSPTVPSAITDYAVQALVSTPINPSISVHESIIGERADHFKPQGFCGTGTSYCAIGGPSQCNKRYGDCNNCPFRPTPPPTCSSPSPTAPIVGNNGACGGSDGAVCAQGLCCSDIGFCGAGEDYCRRPRCQSAFGDCDGCPARTPPTCPVVSDTVPVVGSGNPCGGTSGNTCEPGLCCSDFGTSKAKSGEKSCDEGRYTTLT